MTTTAKVKSYLQITTSTHDSFIDELIVNVTSFISNYTERDFDGLEKIEIQDGGAVNYYLKNYPVAGVTVAYNGSTQSSPVWNTIDSSNYIVNLANGTINFYGSAPSGMQNIKITYTNDNAIIADDMELLAKEIVAREFEQRKAQGKSVETLGGATINWKDTLSPMQAQILDKYVRIIL